MSESAASFVALGRLMDRIGYRFADKGLLERALTHRSKGLPRGETNERLEFLGDRVLGVALADMLYRAFPNEPEGSLSPRFAHLARKETLADVAADLDLGRYVRMSGNEEAVGGRENAGILADACEALLGAVYLDGGHEAAVKLVRAHWQDRLNHAPRNLKDAKTRLQEWAQGHGLPVPMYETAERTGPDHAPVFTIRVFLKTGETAEALGASKRAAEQGAAEALLKQLDATA